MSSERPGTPAPPAPPSSATPPPPAPAVRGGVFPAGTWRSSLREFVVIVAGVLVALMAQALWEGRQEREIERAYLDQLLVDARENQARLQQALQEDSLAAASLHRLLTVVNGTGVAPRDSLHGWFELMGRTSDFKPVTGTHRALLGTGELRLIRDDAVRVAVMRYASLIDSEAERLEQFRGLILSSIGPLSRALPFMQRMMTGGFTADDIDVSALRRDPEVGVVLVTLQAANLNRINGLRRLAAATDELVTVLAARRR